MVKLPNVIIDKNMDNRLKNNTLSMLDELKITLANFAGGLFPASKVYINPNRQNTKLPCLFVSFYEISKQCKLYNLACYEVGFTISYLAEDTLIQTELDNALFLLQQYITDVQNYDIYEISGDITDAIANITGIVRLNEQAIQNDEIINNIKKELTIK